MAQPIEPPDRRRRPPVRRVAATPEQPCPGDGLLDPGAFLDERRDEITLRPRSLDEYIGQERLKANLRVYIKAALKRREALSKTSFAPMRTRASRPTASGTIQGGSTNYCGRRLSTRIRFGK